MVIFYGFPIHNGDFQPFINGIPSGKYSTIGIYSTMEWDLYGTSLARSVVSTVHGLTLLLAVAAISTMAIGLGPLGVSTNGIG